MDFLEQQYIFEQSLPWIFFPEHVEFLDRYKIYTDIHVKEQKKKKTFFFLTFLSWKVLGQMKLEILGQYRYIVSLIKNEICSSRLLS